MYRWHPSLVPFGPNLKFLLRIRVVICLRLQLLYLPDAEWFNIRFHITVLYAQESTFFTSNKWWVDFQNSKNLDFMESFQVPAWVRQLQTKPTSKASFRQSSAMWSPAVGNPSPSPDPSADISRGISRGIGNAGCSGIQASEAVPDFRYFFPR